LAARSRETARQRNVPWHACVDSCPSYAFPISKISCRFADRIISIDWRKLCDKPACRSDGRHFRCTHVLRSTFDMPARPTTAHSFDHLRPNLGLPFSRSARKARSSNTPTPSFRRRKHHLGASLPQKAYFDQGEGGVFFRDEYATVRAVLWLCP